MKPVSCVAVALLAVGLGACGGGETGDAACVLTVEYQGNRYFESRVEVVPREAAPLGTGVVPDCNDAGGEPGPGEEIELAELEGVSPEVAVYWPARPESVLVRESYENRLPAALQREAPTCDPADEPIRLAGAWFGVFGHGDPEEVDLESPYEVELFVSESSAPRYERAFLLVRVPAGLDRPLTRDDLRWLEGGTIDVSAVCRDGRYVAESVAAHRPG